MDLNQRVVDERVDKVLAQFHSMPMAPQILRRIATEQPAQFTISALRHLSSASQSPGHRLLAVLMLRQETILDYLVLPGQALRSINLFRRLQRIDPMIDVRLAQRLPDRSGSNHAIAFTSRNSARALDLLDQTSPGRRLLPVIGHLIDSPDQQICAKAALLIGRRVQSPDWVERQLERGDERVRANAIESIWGVNTTEARTLLEKYVTDSNNRVAGNALVGLHIVGEPGILAHVEKMAHDATPGFRATAAWAMGRMADGRFIGELTTLLKDEDQVVRSAALRSMIELRRTTDMLAADQASKIEEREQAEETPLLIVEPTEAEETPAEQPAPVVFDIKLDGSSFSSSRGSGAYRQ